MTKLVWTTAYSPFILGGHVDRPIGAEMEVGPEVDLGKGFKGHVLRSPNGKMFIVESETGGIIGNSISEVQRDIEVGDKTKMRKQVEEALERLRNVTKMSAKKFWGMMHGV